MKEVDKLIKSSTVWLICLTILCCYCIFTIQLGWFWKFPTTGNYEGINLLLLNLSYSFIAATIFYLVTVWLPSYNRHKRLLSPIKTLKKKIVDDYVASINCFSDIVNQIDYTVDRDMFLTKIQQQSLLEETSMSREIHLNIGTYQSTLLNYHNRVILTISNLLEYKEHLSSEDIVVLETIRNDVFPNLVGMLSTPIGRQFLDNVETRKAVGENLWSLYDKALQLE